MTPLFDVFGAAFFVHVDAQPQCLYWWWYREPLVDLVRMADAEGTDYCIRYMKTQATKRYPTSQPQFHTRASVHNTQSPSMWSTTKPMKHIHDSVVKLMKQNETRRRSANANAMASRKKARTTPTWNEDDDNDE